MATANRHARLGGSAVTVFKWNNDIIAFARQTSITTPTGVGPGTTPIHPLNARRPVELITPIAASMGTMTVELYDLFGQKVWDRIATIANSTDIVDIFLKVAETGSPIVVHKVITPPRGRGGKLTEHYHNIVVSAVQDDETIEIGTMEVMKRFTLNYTHSTISGRNPVASNNPNG